MRDYLRVWCSLVRDFRHNPKPFRLIRRLRAEMN